MSGRKLKKFMRQWGFLNCVRAIHTLQRFARRYSTDICRIMKVRRRIDLCHSCFACSLTPDYNFNLLPGSESIASAQSSGDSVPVDSFEAVLPAAVASGQSLLDLMSEYGPESESEIPFSPHSDSDEPEQS